ncbi:MAG: hypothetical protein M1829_005074 [Trizodia sp. TS-e1964]|nr:MAG: hypothetical protein M1829_005074 [Trizodia sp. TS-e1964]
MKLLPISIYATYLLGKLAEGMPVTDSKNRFPVQPDANTFDGLTRFSGTLPERIPSIVLPPFPRLAPEAEISLLFEVFLEAGSVTKLEGPALLIQNYVYESDGNWKIVKTQWFAIPYFLDGEWKVLRKLPSPEKMTLREQIQSFLPFGYLPPGILPFNAAGTLDGMKPPDIGEPLDQWVELETKDRWVRRALGAVSNSKNWPFTRFPWEEEEEQ